MRRQEPAGYYGLAVIVSDPDALGGFPPGAEVGGLALLLHAGHFTVGTRLKWQGRVYRVRGEVGQTQRLERYQ